MTFDKVNRRTHLYVGILLTPWFLLYAASGLLLNHGGLFPGSHDDGVPEWTRRYEREYRLPAMPASAGAWEMAKTVLKDQGLDGRYRASFDRDGNLVVLRNKFLTTVRLTYYPQKGRILAEDKRFHWEQALTALHFRAGFVTPYFVELTWAVFVDLIALATLVWICSGLYIWIKLKRLRFWGWVSLAGGMASFVAVALRM
jgi:hypothetical protein